MKPRLLILAGLVAAVALAYGLSHWLFTHRAPDKPVPSADPLAWMQEELKVDDAAFAKVKALHESYQPVCGKMCIEIAKANSRVQTLIAQSRTMTPELEEAIRQAQLRHA